MWEYFTSPTFWLIIISVFVILFVFAFCCCLCCRSGDYPGKIIEHPDTEWQPSAPDSPPQHRAATYYPSMPGAAAGYVDGPYVAMTPCGNMSDTRRLSTAVDPASVPPPSYTQVMQANQVYFSPQGPAGLPGPHGPYVPHGPLGPVGPPGARPPAPYGTNYYQQ